MKEKELLKTLRKIRIHYVRRGLSKPCKEMDANCAQCKKAYFVGMLNSEIERAEWRRGLVPLVKQLKIKL